MSRNNDCFSVHFDESEGAMRAFITKPFKVYLAGPLTNNDEETSQHCRSIRATVREEFLRFTGAHFEVYDPGDMTPPGSPHSAEDVYVTDHLMTMDADLVVFHVNIPSLGVGIESQIAADATVPRVVVSKRGAEVSRMFEGVFSPSICEIEYVDLDDFGYKLRGALPSIADKTRQSAESRNPERDSIVKAQIGRAILEGRIRKRMSLAELANRTDVREYWLRRLERNDAQACCLTMIQLKRIAAALKGEIVLGCAGVPSLVFDPIAVDHAQESLGNLIEFVLSDEEWKADQKIFDLWNHNVEELLAAAEGRNPLDHVIAVEEWQQLYNEKLF